MKTLIDNIHYSHFTDQDRVAIAEAGSFMQLGDIALNIIGRRLGDLEMASGPISSGPGTIEDKLREFGATIEYLAEVESRNMFSPAPFENKMRELVDIWRTHSGNNGYCWPLLYEFYWRVFSTGRIVKVNFMPEWNISIGSKWERETCLNLGITQRDIPENIMELIRTRMKSQSAGLTVA